MPAVATDIRDKLLRNSLYAEAMREAAILSAVFGPIAYYEINKSFSARVALVIWGGAALFFQLGVWLQVKVKRIEREL